jgi:hypothetical protein
MLIVTEGGRLNPEKTLEVRERRVLTTTHSPLCHPCFSKGNLNLKSKFER